MRKAKHIALVIERTSEFGRRFLQGVADYFDGRPGVQIDLINPSQTSERAIGEYDGWICRITSGRTLRRLQQTGKPVVDALCFDPIDGISTVRSDFTAIGTMAAEHFLAHGFVHFGFCGYRHVPFSDSRRNAFARDLEDKGFRPNIYRPPYRSGSERPLTASRRQIAEGSFGEPEDADSLLSWLRRLPKPIAVFCCDDFRASDVARLCKRAGIAIPADVAILGVDNDPVYCQFGSPRLSSIDPNAEAFGAAAAEILNEQLSARKPPKAVSRTIPPGEIIVRTSSDAYPGAPAWFANALGYIQREFHTGISASDVFRHVGYSRTLVERAFRAVLRQTVQEKIAEVRLRTAERLLRSTSLPVKDIALQTGYGSIEYFTRKFRASTGCPPAAYRARKDQAAKTTATAPRK